VKFILVNGRTPRPHSFCVMCNQPIAANYLREIGTHLIYCDHSCYADHYNSAILLLESRARASLPVRDVYARDGITDALC
jgi:hypothetical protein